MLLQYFFTAKLTKENPNYNWDPAVLGKIIQGREGFHGSDLVRHTLHLNRAVLDEAAEIDDMNIIKVKTKDIGGAQIDVPVAYLKAGSNYQESLDVSLPDTVVSLCLVRGSGPVHILGAHTVSVPVDDMDDTDEEDADVSQMDETTIEEEAIHEKHSAADKPTNGEVKAANGTGGKVEENGGRGLPLNEKKRKMDAEETESATEAKPMETTDGDSGKKAKLVVEENGAEASEEKTIQV